MSREKVYICTAPLADALAREKISEVFAEGYVPIELYWTCHLRGILPTPENRQAIISECQQIRVYGPEWTDEMWDDIRYALKNNIPVFTDQEMIPGCRPISLPNRSADELKAERKITVEFDEQMLIQLEKACGTQIDSAEELKAALTDTIDFAAQMQTQPTHSTDHNQSKGKRNAYDR